MRSDNSAAAGVTDSPAALYAADVPATAPRRRRKSSTRNFGGDQPPPIRYIRMPRVCDLTGLSPTTIYRREEIGEFPMHVELSERVHGWVEQEVLDWNAKQLAARNAKRAQKPTPESEDSKPSTPPDI